MYSIGHILLPDRHALCIVSHGKSDEFSRDLELDICEIVSQLLVTFHSHGVVLALNSCDDCLSMCVSVYVY